MPDNAPPRLPPPPSSRDAKAAWRDWARSARRRLAGPARSRLVCDAIRAWPPYARAGTVLLYLAFGSEVDLGALAGDAGKRVLVPRSDGGPAGGLSLHLLGHATLERHPFGPMQPAAGTPPVEPASVALALVPGLCFDASGTRLGYGRGYYDRFLPTLPPDVPVVGVSYDALVVDALPREPHDVRVSHLATETGVRALAPSA